MKRCPACNFIYEDDQSLCDMDGVELVHCRLAFLITAKAAAQGLVMAVKSARSRFSVLPYAGVLLGVAAFFSVYYIPTDRTAPAGADHVSAPARVLAVPLAATHNSSSTESPVNGDEGVQAAAPPSATVTAGYDGANTPAGSLKTSADGSGDEAPDSETVNTSDWVSDMTGNYQKITIRNNSKKKSVRISDILVYDCRNVAHYFCGTRTLNMVLPPGGSSDVHTIGPNDDMSGGIGMSFKYKYWAEFADDLGQRPQSRRRRKS